MKPRESQSGISCLLCKGDDCALIEKSTDTFGVYLCKTCDAAFVWPTPNEEILHGAYDQEEYYKEWVGSQAHRRASMWKKRAKKVLGAIAPGRLLDVGCGEGSFMNEAGLMGWDVTGTEISEAGCRLARERFGLAPICSTLQDASLSSESFDVVTLWHVLEHVPEALSLMKEVARLVKRGGLVIVACPNRRSWIYDFAYFIGRGKRPHLFSPADKELHLWHFSSFSLKHLVELASLKVNRIEVDFGHIQNVLRCLDLTAAALYKVSGRLWSPAMEVWAKKN